MGYGDSHLTLIPKLIKVQPEEQKLNAMLYYGHVYTNSILFFK